VGQPGRDPGVNSETAVLFNVNGFENQCGTIPFTPLAENLRMQSVVLTAATATQIPSSVPGTLTLQTPTIYPNTLTNDCLTQNPFIPVTESAEDKESKIWFAEQSLFWSNTDQLSSIVLYNTQGQIIRTIDKQELRMGQYVLGELPSGLYISVANYVDQSSTQLKIIL
jgi:hypothetical protein